MAMPFNAMALLPRGHVNMAGADQNLVAMGQALSDRLGYDLPVISAYRDPAKNSSVKGAPKSQHLHGKALDIDVGHLPLQERQRIIAEARAMGFGGIGIYDNSLHLDTGPVRAWGPSRHSDSIPGWARGPLQMAPGEARTVAAQGGQPQGGPVGMGRMVAQAQNGGQMNDAGNSFIFDELDRAGLAGSPKPAPKPEAKPQPERQNYAEGMVDAVTQGVTLGFGDEMTALENALLGGTADETFWQEYERFLDAERGQQAQFAEDNPISAIGGQVAGAIAPTLLSGGAAAPGAVMRGAQSVARATPAGIAGRILPGGQTALSQAGRAAGAGAAAGAAQGFGEGEGGVGRAVGLVAGAATGAVGGVVGQQVFKGLGRLAGAILGNPAMHRNGTLTDFGRKVLRENGIDPDQAGKELEALFAQRLREGNAGNPDEAARMAVLDEAGISPATRGQATGNPDQLAFEDAARNVGRGRAAADKMREIDTAQRESVDKATLRLGGRMGDNVSENYIDAAGNVGAFIRNDAEAMRQAYQQAYEAASGKGLSIPIGAFEPLVALYQKMPVENVFLAGGKGRTAIEAVGDYLNNVISKAPEGATAIDFQAVEKLRKRLNQIYGAAEKGDKYEVAQVIRGFDDWLDQVFARTLAYGPEDAYAAMKVARGKFREYKQKWGAEGGKSLTAKASKVIEQMAEDDMSPVDVARALYTAGMTGESPVGRAIAMRLKDRLPEEVFGSVKAGLLYHAISGGTATKARGYRMISQRLRRLVDGEGGPMAKAVFTAPELAQIRRFARAIEILDTPDIARNPSKTSYGIARLMSDSFPALAGMMGMSAGGPVGAIAAAGGGAARQGIGNWLAARGLVAARATRKPVGSPAIVGGGVLGSELGRGSILE